jgi:hypothetical protein
MIDRKSVSYFIKGFGFAALMLLLAAGGYGVQTVLAQTGGNQTSGTTNDAWNTEQSGVQVSGGENAEGPNVQVGGESVLLNDNPGTVFVQPSTQNLPENNIAPNLIAPDAFGTENIAATPYGVVIPAADFTNDGLNPNDPFFSFSEGAWNGHINWPCMMAPAYLPNGVTIAEFWGTFDDTSDTAQGEMRLYRHYNYSATTSDLMASIGSGYAFNGGFSNPGDTSIDYPVVDYPNYSYFVGGCMDSDLVEFIGVRIYYWP